MGLKRGMNEAVWSSMMMVLLLVGFGRCDLNQDKAECTDKLLGLASCLPYVGGDSKAPTLDCCTGLKGVIDKSKRCLCILIKDHDDPNLGLKINVTLALDLPTTCKTPTNITECVDLLHLPPNSPDAKEFEGYDKALKTNSSAPASSARNATHGAGSNNKSDGGWGKRWVVTEVLWAIIALALALVLV